MEAVEAAERGHGRRARRHARHEADNVPTAIVFFAAAAALLYFAAASGRFWLVFIALGLGLAGAGHLPRRTRTPKDAPPSPGERTTAADDDRRLDEVAKQLLQEVSAGGRVFGQVIARPRQTIEGLRAGYHALAARERALRSAIDPAEDARLEEERQRLKERVAAESDPPARQRFEEALKALELQQSERASLLTAANRLEAERIRLRLTLEGLHAQVLRARTLHGSPDLGDEVLRQTLEQLSDQVGAVADALEEVNRGPLLRGSTR